MREDGQPIKKRLRKERVDENDILASARMSQGLEPAPLSNVNL
jgi:hypothetical protein